MVKDISPLNSHVVAIITKNTQSSASVNQELGYAQGKGISKIPMIEKDALKGIFVHGRDVEEFVRENFEDVCNTVREQIIQAGVRKKPFTDEERLIQKSAHFRFELKEHLNSFFINLIIINKDSEADGMKILLDERKRKLFYEEMGELFQDNVHFYDYMRKLTVGKIKTIIISIEQLKIELKDIERLPHQDLLTEEMDAFIKLRERVRETELMGLHVIDNMKSITKKEDERSCFFQIIEQMSNHDGMIREFQMFNLQVRLIVRAVVSMYKTLENMESKYGDMIFRDFYDTHETA